MQEREEQGQAAGVTSPLLCCPRVGCVGGSALPGATSPARPQAPLTTVSGLVRAVPAVIAAVTQPLLGDAAMVLALKLGL